MAPVHSGVKVHYRLVKSSRALVCDPPASVTTSVMVCAPGSTSTVRQRKLTLVERPPTGVANTDTPSTNHSTVAKPSVSDTDASIVTLPETRAPSTGDVKRMVDADPVEPELRRPNVTLTVLAVDALPEKSVATKEIV